MKKIGITLAIIGLVFIGFFMIKSGLDHHQSRLEGSFRIAKAWWPVWDTFQIGVAQQEEIQKRYQTLFIQKEDYVPALEVFVNGEADAATLTIYEAILAASKGTPLKIVLLLDYTTGSDGVVAKQGIHSIAELKGKTIGVQKGTIAHFTLLKMLEKGGLDPKEINLVDLNLDQLQKAFLYNEIDAAALYEPYMSNLVRQGNGHIIFSSREIPRAICDVLFVKEDLLQKHPDLIDHWIVSWHAVLDFKERSARRYLGLLSRLNGTPEKDIENSFEGIFFTNMAENKRAFGTSESPGYLVESIRAMEQFMFDEEIIKKHVSPESLVDFKGIQRFFK